MSDIQLSDRHLLMEPQPGNVLELEGTLNPAAVRGPDGQLYLFPRLVGSGNFSRIGICRVQFNVLGDPCAVERIGIALEPDSDYECNGCEDPRVSFVEPLQKFVMTYTALSARGPRIALAISEDLLEWRRQGLATFGSEQGRDWEGVSNKDAALFPATILDPEGRPALALLHRPTFSLTSSEPESIWISYLSLEGRIAFTGFHKHTQLATSVASWEEVKIGSGPPPVLCTQGWLLIYHGVRHDQVATPGSKNLIYSAGLMILDHQDPRIIAYRAPEPVLTPLLPLERFGTVENVVFPSGIDRRDDLGSPNRFDVYYGMADSRIGVARLDLPDNLGIATDHQDRTIGMAQDPLSDTAEQKAR